jgi:BMFP domain-containing protein YqiC
MVMGFYQAQKIEKLEARIKELEAELACSIVSGNDAREQALGYVYELNEAAKRIAELEAALKPFADMKIVDATQWEGEVALYGIAASDLRAARAALNGEKE